jgi:antitoxin component of RelBE/YafQ-DinJ toxin-antitoxin module|tara:strand:+ start:564 stop:1484 length:921 start_codon:yes stop_codon:yes gene_type:complete
MTRYRKTITESYQEIQEKLKPSDGAGAYVKDFRKSDAPQFKGKSDKKIRDMAIAAYLDDKEENMKIENAFSIKERKAVITIDVRKPQVDRHVKQIMKKVGNKVKATKTAKGYVMSGDTKDLTTVVDFLFDKNLKNIINPKDMPMDIKMLKNQNETLSKKVKDELEGEQKEDMSKFYDDKALGLTKPKTYNPKTKKFEDHQVHLKTSYEKYTGVVNPFTEGRRSAYASDDEDEEGANKNIVMQLRKSLNLRGRYDVTFDDGKKVKVKEPIARAAIEKHMTFRTSRDKLAFQNKIGKSYRDLLNAIKR